MLEDLQGWNFSVSTTRFVRPDPARDPADALYPDVFIPTTMRDIREGRDPVLEWLRHGPGAQGHGGKFTATEASTRSWTTRAGSCPA